MLDDVWPGRQRLAIVLIFCFGNPEAIAAKDFDGQRQIEDVPTEVARAELLSSVVHAVLILAWSSGVAAALRCSRNSVLLLPDCRHIP